MYNPFDVEFDKINSDNLSALIEKQISEGWYVEYKSAIPKANQKLDNIKIAKSVSAFANTKGGWIIWGITSDNNNRPIAINGIDISEYINLEDQLSQVINSNVTPKPFYNFRRIKLENDRIVLIIKVEESPIPPYITSQGVIYQRENNECKPIKDRYIIEKLNEKTSNYYESIERFSKFDLAETKGQSEDNQTFLELYLFPLPFEEYNFKQFYNSNFFKNTAIRFYEGVQFNTETENKKSTIILNLGFNSIYSSERSIIIKPLNESNLIYKSTTVELFENGNLKFLIPLYEFKSKDFPEHYEESKTLTYILDKYSPYERRREFNHLLPENGSKYVMKRTDSHFTNYIEFIDGHELILNIMIVINTYKAILQDNDFDLETNIGFRAKITGIWRKFIFFDNDDYLEKLKLYNIPISPKNEIEIPQFRNGNCYEIKLSEQNAILQIAKFIMEGIGLPDSNSIKFNEIINKAFERHEKIAQ